MRIFTRRSSQKKYLAQLNNPILHRVEKVLLRCLKVKSSQEPKKLTLYASSPMKIFKIEESNLFVNLSARFPSVLSIGSLSPALPVEKADGLKQGLPQVRAGAETKFFKAGGIGK